MAVKKKSRKEGGVEKGYTYDLDVAKRLAQLVREKKILAGKKHLAEKNLGKSKNRHEIDLLEHCMEIYARNIKEIDERVAFLTAQGMILECDDKPVDVKQLEKRSLEDQLAHAYCAKCASPDLKITRIIQIECRKCGRKRLITARLDESKR